MTDEISIIENKLINNKQFQTINKKLKKTECGKITKKVENTIYFLYHGIIDGYLFANNIIDNNEIMIEYDFIKYKNSIPKPKTFNDHFYPYDLRSDMLERSNFKLKTTFKINNCLIIIHIVTELTKKDTIESKLQELLSNIKNIISWLYFSYRLSKCSQTMKSLTVYFYKIDNPKLFPNKQGVILEPRHVNSGYSDICNEINSDIEIVVFRSQEWFKVLVHETMHAFNLSLSNYDNNFNNILKQIFGLNINYLLSEVYCEYWARIINIVYKSYSLSKNNKNIFLLNFIKFLDIERQFAILQAIKVSEYNNLSICEFLIKDNNKIHQEDISIIKKKQYKEKTSVFCYYILTAFLLVANTKTIEWCYDTNSNIINFNKINKQNNINFINLLEEIISLKCIKDYIYNFDNELNRSHNMFEKNSRILRMSINHWIE